MTYHEVLDLILDDKDVTVGGGCASALAGAQAAGLIGMVVGLSKGKDYGCTDEEYDKALAELSQIKEELLQGSVEDTKAYMLIVNAYKLPKSTEEEKTIRKKAIQDAGIAAAEVPRKNGLNCKKVLQMALELEHKTNSNAGTDMRMGIALSRAGMEGCRQNVEVNLPLIKDEKIVADFHQAMEEMKA